MIWTDMEVQVLTAKWLGGAGVVEIATALGKTPDSVRSKRFEMGLRSRADDSGEALKAAQRASGLVHRTKSPTPPKAVAKASLFAPLADSEPRCWVTRRFGECAFPVGGEGADTLSCCLPEVRDGRGYCVRHDGIMVGRA